MKKEQKNSPNLRFKGFTEDWELCKLGDLANIVGGGTPNTNNPKCWDGNIDWYAPAEIKEKIYVTGSKKRITELGLQKSSAKVLPIGTVLFTSRAGIGNTAILAKKGTTNQGFQSIIPNKNKLDTYFIFSRTHELKKYGEAVGAGSTFVEVSGKQMAKMPMLTPRFNEQQAIGMFFKKIDDIITLHQRELDQLKELKKAYLQVMFPVKDERVPRLRFAAFEDDWKLCKLGSILEERNEQMAENNEYYLMSFVQGKGVTPKGDRYDRSFLVKDEKKKYKKTEFGDFIYSSNNLERGSIGFNRTGKALISPVYSIFKSKNQLESQFIGILSERKSFINRMTKFRQGVVYGQWRIHEADFLNVEVRIPSHMEQKGIIKFFSNLDNMIIVHQNKLNQLKALKKAYLQNMFI
ncbi:restriction endonuclease subunit S [Enterococcus faecalis]|nr:restriction endonuclease subunit S [Enterococcus faecalis]